jgi:small conductance mechanosensitive channel
MQKFNDFISDHLPDLLVTALIVVIGYIFIKILTALLKRILTKTKIEHTAVTFALSIIKVFLYLVLIITALSTLGVNVTSIVTTIGAGVLAAGLALQDTLSNIASGMIILLNKPFVAGDILEFEGLKGRVQSIKIFTTTIHTLDNKIVTIPNSRLTSNNIVNCTMIDKRRLDLKYTISYDDNISKVKGLLFSLISSNDKVLTDPEPSVYVGNHLDSGIEIVVLLWVVPDDYYDVYYFMQENVKLTFDENGITIPYPHVVVKNDK